MRTFRVLSLAVVTSVVLTGLPAWTSAASAGGSPGAMQPAGVGQPPKGYPSVPSAPVSPTGHGTHAAVTNPQGDYLSVSQVHVGYLTTSSGNATDQLTWNGTTYYENCTPPGMTNVYTGTTIPICAYEDIGGGYFHQIPDNNSATDVITDACGQVVDRETTYAWHIYGTTYTNPAWVGSPPYSIPNTGACWGQWTAYYAFSQTYPDGATLTDSNSVTFWVSEPGSQLASEHPQTVPSGGAVQPTEALGGCTCGYNVHGTMTNYPVDTGSGNFWHTFDDLAIAGRGPGLHLSRTYNSAAAATDSPFGFGWTSSYAASLSATSSTAVVTLPSGSQSTFTLSGTTWTAPSRVLAALTRNSDGTWTFTRTTTGLTYAFDTQGRLTSLADRNGYSTTLTRPSAAQLVVTDSAGRTLTFTLTGTHVTSVVDSSAPARTVSYAYDLSGNLTDVIDVGGGHWQFSYDNSHRMLTMRSPRYFGDTTTSPSPVVTNHYDASGRVDWQSDQLGRTTTFDYSSIPGSTKVTDPKGNVTVDQYTAGLLTARTRAYGTALAATTYYRYDPNTLGPTWVIDPLGHATRATYDSAGNALTRTDPVGRVTTYTYNSLNEPLTITEPKQVNGKPITTTLTYDARGNLLTTTSPLLDATGAVTSTATITNAYSDSTHPGDLTSMTDPNNLTTTFTYDTYGERVSMTDPAGDKTTYGYDTGRGVRTSMVSPNGNVTGANAAQFTSTYAYDAFDRLTQTRDPLWTSTSPKAHETVQHYDADGNVSSTTDGNNNTTSYTYDPAEQQTRITRADGSTLQADYWPDGTLHDQYDGLGNSTNYSYDQLAHVTAIADPLGRITSYAPDAAGNVTTKTNPAGGTTSYSYDPDNELVATSYSDGTPSTTISFDADGQRIAATDGSGTSTWTWDTLHRLTSATNGANATTSYGYDIGGRTTSITYPGTTGTVTRGYDSANRLHTLTDWNSRTSTFNYDASSNLTSTVYPNNTTATSTVNPANQITAISDAPTATPTTPFATFGYSRDGANQVSSATTTGVPADTHTFGYDTKERLTTVDQSSYSYDKADNLTKRLDSTQQLFDPANQDDAATTAPAIVFVGATSAGNSSKNPLTFTYPSGSQAGDEVVLATTLDNGKSVTTPPGYTVLGTYTSGTTTGSAKIVVYTHVLASTDTSVTLSYQGSLSKSATLTVYRNVHPKTPIEANAATSVASGTTVKTSPVQTTGAGDHVLFIGGADGTSGTWTAPTGMTSRTTVTGGATDMIAAEQTVPYPGTYPQNPATHSISTALVGVTIALKPVQVTNAYNSAGDRTGTIDLAGNTTGYSYDMADRLTKFNTTSTYGYNIDNLRTSKTIGATTTNNTWDTSTGTPLLLSDGSANYIYGPGGTPLEQVTSTSTAFLHQDHLGSTRVLTDTTGAVTATYSYDPYGRLSGKTGTADTPLRWAGQYQDSDTGLYYLRARYYDPTTAQFLTRDPIISITRSAYGYVYGNPLNGTDPTGLDCGIFSGLCQATSAVSDAVSAVANVGGSVASGVADAGTWIYNHPAEAAGYVAVGAGIVAVGALTLASAPISLPIEAGVLATTASVAGFTGTAAGLIQAGIYCSNDVTSFSCATSAAGSALDGVGGAFLTSTLPEAFKTAGVIGQTGVDTVLQDLGILYDRQHGCG